MSCDPQISKMLVFFRSTVHIQHMQMEVPCAVCGKDQSSYVRTAFAIRGSQLTKISSSDIKFQWYWLTMPDLTFNSKLKNLKVLYCCVEKVICLGTTITPTCVFGAFLEWHRMTSGHNVCLIERSQELPKVCSYSLPRSCSEKEKKIYTQ